MLNKLRLQSKNIIERQTMKVKLYSLKDKVSEVYHPVVQLHNHEQAKRHFLHLYKNDPSTIFAQCPGDFSLYCVGEFDDSQGTVIGKPTNEFIFNCAEFMRLDKPAEATSV